MLLLFLNFTSAQQCSCTSVAPFDETVQYSYAIFSGKVLEVNLPDSFNPRDPNSYPSVAFEATHVWKGPVHETYTISTPYDSPGGCEFAYVQGQEYLVYAGGGSSLGEESFQSGLCSSRTELVTLVSDDIAQLNVLYPNSESTTGIDDVTNNSSFTWLWIILSIILVVLIIYLIARSVKKRNAVAIPIDYQFSQNSSSNLRV